MGKILFVDNDPGQLKIAEAANEITSHELICVNNGEEALHRLLKGDIDLLITDYEITEDELDPAGITLAIEAVKQGVKMVIVNTRISVEAQKFWEDVNSLMGDEFEELGAFGKIEIVQKMTVDKIQDCILDVLGED